MAMQMDPKFLRNQVCSDSASNVLAVSICEALCMMETSRYAVITIVRISRSRCNVSSLSEAYVLALQRYAKKHDPGNKST